ncbi:hypothetical protein Vqi01_25480 [Micromonospora qiuiae]|uniref:Uncharacterized protein n=2 Tax=Micromonospora qiuiae TaxID=502268 RepID=A0ABQ4JB32_9ACTN|nr:hypothetical protein Vqi01_25480 [Micromonospora qiuiae]
MCELYDTSPDDRAELLGLAAETGSRGASAARTNQAGAWRRRFVPPRVAAAPCTGAPEVAARARPESIASMP